MDGEPLRVQLLANASRYSGSQLERVCRAGRMLAGLDGVAVVDASDSLAGWSGEIAQRFAAAQLAMGEGPFFPVLDSGRPEDVEDLREDHPVSWPLLADVMRREGVSAVFSRPLSTEGLVAGVIHLVRFRAGGLEPSEEAASSALADCATDCLLYRDAGIEGEALARLLGLPDRQRANLHAAMGLLWRSRDCTTGRALAILLERAGRARIDIGSFAEMVASGEIAFE